MRKWVLPEPKIWRTPMYKPSLTLFATFDNWTCKRICKVQLLHQSAFMLSFNPKSPMVKMDSCPLPELLEEIIGWCFKSKFPLGAYLPCTKTQLETVLKYFSIVEVDSDFSLRMYRKLRLDGAWQDRFNDRIYRRASQLVVNFLEDLGELFTVPKVQQLSQTNNTLKKNEVVAGFITFLLQLLQSADLDSLSRFPVLENHVTVELRFLVTVIGETPFQATEDEQVQGLLAEFEQVANQAGIIVHSLNFVPYAVVNRVLDVFLEHTKLLKSNIIKFLDSSTNIVNPISNGGVDSLFIVDSLLQYLEDLMTRNDNPLFEVKDLVKAFCQWLMLCESLLKVPERKEIKELMNEPMVQVGSVAYDGEYLIKSFLVQDVSLWYLTIRLTHHITNIEFIATRLQEMNQDYDNRTVKDADDSIAQQSIQAKKDSLAYDITVGLEQQEKTILDQLVQGTKTLQEIFIFGMPGIGKTTLAKKVYHHPFVGYHFDKSLWCVVSHIYQRKKLLTEVLSCVKSDLVEDTMMTMDEEHLEQEIYKSLKDRRYLIVIDDIWDSKVCEDFRRFFPNDENGSRMLFTSRNKDVAPCSSIIHELLFLSKDQCWELLEKKVFHNNNHCPPNLHEIGKKIASKCNGLPLAVVVIAGILSTMDKEESAWENVEQSLDCYMLSDISNSMMQILELSYTHLPRHLKLCFLYFGAFEEDEEIPVKKLTQLWIAEGFIHRKEKKVETKAEEYLMELIDKSLVIVAKKRSDGGVKACIIHDLLRDFCLRIAQKENFLKSTDYECSRWNHRYSRLCLYMKPLYPSSTNNLEPYGQHTRAVFCTFWESSLSVLNMKLLRVLDCRRAVKVDLLGIEVLVHLRYLAVNKMPTSLHNNVNLQFLIVNDQVFISSNILKMEKLKCIRSRKAILSGDYDIFQTSKLEFLSLVLIRSLEDLEMLKCFPDLCKLKCRCYPFWEEKGRLVCLDLHFLIQLESLRVSSLSQIDEIKFPLNIKKLTLIHLCLPWERMLIIGELPYLEVLKLEDSAFRGERWDTSDGKFMQLRILKLWYLDLVWWNVSSNKHFPKLQQLSLESCSKLIEIPREIGEIETLQLIKVGKKCRKSLVESAIRIQEEQLDMGNEELRVAIRNRRPSTE